MNAPPHLFTLTGNLLAERTLEFERWSPGATQRAAAESFQVGGKGINVSKMLNRLGAPNTALCFAGGAPGAECEAWLRAKNFSLQIFPTTAATRTGVVVRSGQLETTFLGVDTPPDAAAIRACADYINSLPAGALAICGSIPGWSSSAFNVLRDALHRWPERGSLVVDTYGAALEWLINESAALVRINRTELNSLCRAGDARRTLGSRHLAHLERVGNVLFHRHVRIQSVILEHHRHIPLLRPHLIDAHTVEQNVTFARVFQTRNHAHRRSLAAARGAEQHQKFAIRNLQVHRVHAGDATPAFGESLERYCGHRTAPEVRL